MAKKKKQEELVSVETQQPSVVESHNVKALAHLMMLKEIAKPNIDDPNQVDIACKNYIGLCVQNDQKPLVSGLAMVLGVSRKDLLDILQGKMRSEARDVIKEYFAVLETYDELALKDGKINAVAGIFLGKNNYGYTDGVKVEIVKEEESNEEIASRYKDFSKIIKGEVIDITSKNDDSN